MKRGKPRGWTPARCDKEPRAALLVKNLWELATLNEDGRLRLAATKEILDRVDGKVIERKEIKKMKIEGIVYLPATSETIDIGGDIVNLLKNNQIFFTTKALMLALRATGARRKKKAYKMEPLCAALRRRRSECAFVV